MAKPKVSVLTKIIAGQWINVYVNDARENGVDVNSIEGVDSVYITGENELCIFIDPRYDIQEIASEIEELLTAEVPDIFKE